MLRRRCLGVSPCGRALQVITPKGAIQNQTVIRDSELSGDAITNEEIVSSQNLERTEFRNDTRFWCQFD
jgi:hypothetical protein